MVVLSFYAISFWYSRRLRCITLSTAEAELVAASVMAKELMGALNFLEGLFAHVPGGGIRFSVEMVGDNQAANLIASGQAGVRKVRHLSLADLYVREVCDDGRLTVRYVKTTENPSDMLTKPLNESVLVNLLPLVGLVQMPSHGKNNGEISALLCKSLGSHVGHSRHPRAMLGRCSSVNTVFVC